MDWFAKYRTEFTDLLKLDWRIDIEEWVASQGSITTMQATSTPLTIDYLTNSDDILNEPIKGSTASISVYSDTNFEWSNLYSYGQLKYRVSIYYSTSVLYWRGYINSESYQEPYDGLAYPVLIHASDGLGQLKDHLYNITDPYPSGDIIIGADYYNNHIFESQIICDILAKINVTGFAEFVNIYETSINHGTGDSPFDQIYIDADLFKDMDCYEVLTEILKKYNAVIRCKAGVYIIYRPIELTNATVYGRIFTDAYNKTSTTITPAQLLDRSTSVTSLHDIEGGIMMIQSPVKLITVNQDYGNKESWVDNWDLKNTSYDGAGSFANWSGVSCNSDILPNNGVLNEEAGMVVTTHNVGSALTKYKTQTFGSYAKASGDELNLSIDFMFINTSYTAYAGNHCYIDVICGGWYLWAEPSNTEYWGWANISTHHIDCAGDVGGKVGSSYVGRSAWTTLNRKIRFLPFDGPIEIRIYGMTDTQPSVYPVIRNIKFTQPSGFIYTVAKQHKFLGFIPTYWRFAKLEMALDAIVKKKYLKANSINGISTDYSYILGDVVDSGVDNTIEQFAGALVYGTRDNLTQTAADFVTNHGSDYTGITVSSYTNHINFDENDGNDFTGSTTITNLTGDLSGTPITLVTHITAIAQVDQVTKSSYPAGCNITCGGLTKALSWVTNATISMQGFVATNASYYSAIGILLTNGSAGQCLFTANVAGTPFTAASSNGTGNSYNNITPNTVGRARSDSITLSGVRGTANITLDAVTKGVDVDESVPVLTSTWATRGHSENKALISLIGDELANQYSRPKQLIQLPIIEQDLTTNTPQLNIIGTFEDQLNQIGGNNRVFVFNRGTFNVRDREWSLDLVEII